jgi:hypothetical protein
MTVEVQIPEGMKSGSSVMEVRATKHLKLTSEERAGSAGIRGEAVVVDLPDGPIFVTLDIPGSGQGLYYRVTKALAPDTPGKPVSDLVTVVGKLGGWFASAKAELPYEYWPMMLRFRNLADSKSVEKVDPAVIGVRRILLETTSDEVTTGIKKRLTWLRSRGGLLDSETGPTTNPTFAQTIHFDAFWLGVDQ